MYSKNIFQQLLVAVALLSVAQSTWMDKNKLNVGAIAERQIGGLLPDGTSSEKSTQGTATGGTTPTPTSSPSASTTSTPSTTPSTTSTSSTPSSTPTPTTSSDSETSASSSPQSTSSTPKQTTSNSPSPHSSTPTPVVSTIIEVVTSTNTDGSKTTFSTTSKTTSTPGLSSGNGETSGMSPKTRNTVIGVVVGVGGAIVLGALGLVAWRIWGRKKHTEENDGLMDYDMSTTGGVEKSERGSSAGGPQAQRTPFQSTLENYHQPGQVNASSNF